MHSPFAVSGTDPGHGRPAKSWVFTVNNWTQIQLDALETLGGSDDVSYLVVGRETGDSGTPHLQGCITTRKAHRRSAMSLLIPHAWLAPAFALVKAREYCMKEDQNPLVVDSRAQGSRTDLSNAIDLIKETGLGTLISDAPEVYVKYHAGLEKLAAHLQVPRNPGTPPEVIWIYGSTGTGKSRYVHEQEEDLWVSMGTHKWWEGYLGQEAMLIDDMRCNYAPFNELLKIIDRYPYRAERKGSSVQVNSARIYITSQFPPHRVYNRENRQDEDIRQLYRRLTAVYKTSATFSSLSNSTYSFVKHGVLFERQDVELLLKEDQGSALHAGFNLPPCSQLGLPSW